MNLEELNNTLARSLRRFVSDLMNPNTPEESLWVYYEDYMFKIKMYGPPLSDRFLINKFNRIPSEDPNNFEVVWSDLCCWESKSADFQILFTLFLEEDIQLEKEYEQINIGKEDFAEIIKYNREARNKEKYEAMKTIPDTDSYVKCLCCEKVIPRDEYGCLHHAGYAYLEFHYGSQNDQGHGFGGSRLDCTQEDHTRKEKLLACDLIEAYVCDDCFDKKLDVLKGFVKVSKITHERKA